jgi:hypothetical protein
MTLARRADSNLMPPLGPARVQDFAAPFLKHAASETVLGVLTLFCRLVGPFHTSLTLFDFALPGFKQSDRVSGSRRFIIQTRKTI